MTHTSANWQTLLTAVVVGLAAVYLLRAAYLTIRKKRRCGCGDTCGQTVDHGVKRQQIVTIDQLTAGTPSASDRRSR